MPPVVNGDDPKEAVAKAIKENSVMVFSKSWCPFCKKLKAAFKLNRIDFEAVELDELGTMGEDMQKILLEQTGQKTVPSVFINGKHIGKSVLYRDDVIVVKWCRTPHNAFLVFSI